MKTLALLILLAGTSIVLADENLLKNGDFSNGINHWEGDCHTIDSTTFDPSVTPPTSGIIIKLHGSGWAQVTQDFKGKIGEYTVSVVYSVSPDLKFSDRKEDYINIPGLLGFSRLKGFDAAPGQWALIINDLGAMHYNYWKITPKLDPSAVQKVNVRIQLDSDDTVDKGFYLVFPPGEGFINLQSITMVPQGGSTP